MNFKTIETACADFGLIARGGFYPMSEDGVPGHPATLVLIGNAGPEMWRIFEGNRPKGPDLLDFWTRAAISDIAKTLGVTALFPFDGPPYLPFQRWAMKADTVFPSPIGPLIHPEYGLWHAYRGALAFDEKLPLPEPAAAVGPCDTCAEKPCLSTCPVDALAPGNYDVPACVAHIGGPNGADCLDLGCRARRACPIGREYVHAPTQARFHMDHFRRANRPQPGAG